MFSRSFHHTACTDPFVYAAMSASSTISANHEAECRRHFKLRANQNGERQRADDKRTEWSNFRLSSGLKLMPKILGLIADDNDIWVCCLHTLFSAVGNCKCLVAGNFLLCDFSRALKMEEDDPKEYRWETGYEKTWEAIKEDDDGLLDNAIAEIIQKAKRKRQAQKTGHSRLGMMRHLQIIVDCSESMGVPDLKPTRLLCTVKLMERFIEEFFDQNPISQLGLIALKNKRAETITDLAGNCRKHFKAIQSLTKVTLSGEPSLQNGLDLAMKTLKLVPSHASREILIIMGSLTTCDPVDLNITIEGLKSEGIRCSVVSLSAEIRVCRFLTQETGGNYGAVLDDAHYKDQLLQHVDPPPAAQTQENSLIKMGFPHGQFEDGKDPPHTMCMCHIDNTDDPSKLSSGGYHCPQCLSKYCELPVECISCGLTLVSAPHLARSYHHLFPVQHFHELDNLEQAELCYACQKVFNNSDKKIYQCQACHQYFCNDCDIFIHDTLHTCVGCTTIPSAAQNVHLRKPIAPASNQF